jgi:hypothetical protein
MKRSRTRVALALALAFALVAPATGAEHSDRLEPLRAEVDGVIVDLENDPDPEFNPKKLLKILRKSSTKIEQGLLSGSAAGELKALRIVSGKLSKKAGPGSIIPMLMEQAASGYRGDIMARLDAVRDQLALVPEKITPRKVQKAIDVAQLHLNKSDTAKNIKSRVTRLASAEKHTTRAEGLLEKLPAPPCPGNQLLAGEVMAGSFGALNTWDVWGYEPVPQTGSRWLRMIRCEPFAEVELLVRFPYVALRPIGDKATDAFVRYRFVPGGRWSGATDGAINVLSWDNATGAISIEFAFSNDADSFTGGVLQLKNFRR